VTVQATILGRAGAQMMGGIETEALGYFDHRVSDPGRPVGRAPVNKA
jgi:hypothetical protein